MRWLFIFILATGCAATPSKNPVSPPMPSRVLPQVVTALSFAQPAVVSLPPPIGPTLVMVDKNDWRVVYPDGFPSTNYIWTMEVSTNLSGAWVEQSQEWYNETTLLVHSPPQPWFMRLHGTTNILQ